MQNHAGLRGSKVGRCRAATGYGLGKEVYASRDVYEPLPWGGKRELQAVILSREESDQTGLVQGGWADDLKQGLGKKVYANGDVYEGLWKGGKCEGPGRYRWRNNNEYDGEWKAGRMHGRGTLKWHTGGLTTPSTDIL